MQTTTLKLTLSTLCCVAAGWNSLAGPLQRADVVADPAWALHINADTLRPSGIGQYLLAEMEKPEAQAKLAAFQALFNFDLRKQLHGVTLYGTSVEPADAVLMVYADFDPDRLVTLAQSANDYQSTKHNQHVIHNWVDENKKGRPGAKPRTYAAIQGNRVIFGQREAAVAAALDVLDGKAANLGSGKNFPQLGAAGNTSFIQGAARKLDLPDSDPNAAIFRLSKLIRLELGETEQKVTATLSLEADNEEVAGHIASIGQGLVALLKLNSAKPEAVKVAAALSLKQDATAVLATFAMPVKDAVDLLKAEAARKAAKQAANEAGKN